jgi:hypothetical protein
MYSTCIFCNASLGANEAVEHFPVGRRLAFDAARGRLWAVCALCGRWNLTPLEERWEAVEECERLFSSTRVRVSTEQIGLARLAEGTELVRIGKPLRPEFAAWRYGEQFGARLRRSWLTAGSLAGVGAALAGAAFVTPAALVLLAGVPVAELLKRRLAPTPGALDLTQSVMALKDGAGEPIMETDRSVTRARIRTGEEHENGWALDLQTMRYDPNRDGHYMVDPRGHLLAGPPALRAATVLLARANLRGATRSEVAGAVARLDRSGGPREYFLQAEAEARKVGWGYRELWGMPAEIRLALEMATHEDSERRAMEGDLAELEAYWRDAEAIAAVADRLALPAGVEGALKPLRRR